jgi:hypothetical protein
MHEDDPFQGGEEQVEPTKVELKGPNVTSTFDVPPSPDAVEVHEASIRKHLEDRRREGNPPGN